MPNEITLNHITKIEGHAKLELGIERGKVTKCELSSVEGSRYFEALVLGRQFNEAHEITSRICGICSCAHVVAAISAIESALKFTPSEQTRELRLLLTYGERIRSHATHLYFLALPDYLGYESALAMASKYKPQLQDALRLVRMGNSIIKTIGGRDLHPVSATVGGWLKLPSRSDLASLKEQLEAAKDVAERTFKLFNSLEYPKFESTAEMFSLANKKDYATVDGAFTSKSTSFDKDRYLDFIREYHEERSTANFVVKSDSKYMVGALPRVSNNQKHLSIDARKKLKASQIKLPSSNPFYNNLAQAIELIHYIDDAIRICGSLDMLVEPVEKLKFKAGSGVGAIEAPRGVLWHDYSITDDGTISKANIITPTAQNLLCMQEDIRAYVPMLKTEKKEDIVGKIEKLIRSYDPCFSCSSHFLEVNWV